MHLTLFSLPASDSVGMLPFSSRRRHSHTALGWHQAHLGTSMTPLSVPVMSPAASPVTVPSNTRNLVTSRQTPSQANAKTRLFKRNYSRWSLFNGFTEEADDNYTSPAREGRKTAVETKLTATLRKISRHVMSVPSNAPDNQQISRASSGRSSITSSHQGKNPSHISVALADDKELWSQNEKPEQPNLGPLPKLTGTILSMPEPPVMRKSQRRSGITLLPLDKGRSGSIV